MNKTLDTLYNYLKNNIIGSLKQHPSSLIYYLLLFIIIAVGVIIRLKVYIYNQSFYMDESLLAINILKKSIPEFFSSLDFYQISPPIFCIISKIILNISGQEHNLDLRDSVLKFFPFISSIISLFIFPLLLKKINQNKYFITVGCLLFTFNPILINYSSVFKQYELEVLISIILIYTFANFDLKEKENNKIILYSLLIGIAPYFSLSSFFIIASIFLNIAIDCIKNSNFNIKKLLYFIIPSITCLTIYFITYLSKNLSLYTPLQTEWNGKFQMKFLNFYNAHEVINENLNLFFPNINSYLIILLVTVSIVIFFILKKNDYKLSLLLLIPIYLCIFAGFMNLYPFYERFLLFLLPNIIILLVYPIILIKNNKILTCIIAIFIVVCSYIQTNQPTDKFIRYPGYTKDLFLLLKSHNPDLKNMFIAEPDFVYYAWNQRDKYNLIVSHPDVEKINTALTTLNKNEKYWIFISNYFDNTVDKVVNHIILKQKNIEYIKIRPEGKTLPENIYILCFTKK